MTAGLRLRVDPIACDGRGLCAEVLPELIQMDDWGFPIVRDEPVPARLRTAAGEAVRICPKLALGLEPGPGQDRGGPGRAGALWRHPAAAHQRDHPGNVAVPAHGGRRAGPARQRSAALGQRQARRHRPRTGHRAADRCRRLLNQRLSVSEVGLQLAGPRPRLHRRQRDPRTRAACHREPPVPSRRWCAAAWERGRAEGGPAPGPKSWPACACGLGPSA